MRYCFVLLALLFLLCSTDSPVYPTNYFRSPVKHQMRLSGSFGELRRTHFHFGIDIKSAQGSGDEIVAAAEGYISRIKVQAGGYGNALYINHPNGYKTVYAHLSRLAPEFAALVKSEQYTNESFEVDLKLDSTRFVVEKGEYIGNLGNTGSSGGPHLHFEIRETETDAPINPLLFGLSVADTRRPMMNQVRVYSLNNKGESLAARTYDLYGAGKLHKVRGDTIYTSSKEVGVALKSYDQMNGANNWNGVYRMTMLEEEEIRFQFEMEKLPFDEIHYIHAHVDYEDRVTKKSYFNRCFLLPGNRANIYDQVENNGILRLQDNRATKVTIISEDLGGNVSKAQFWVKYRPTIVKKDPKTHNYFLLQREENAIDNGQIYVYFDENSFYEDVYLDYQMSLETSDNVYSVIHHLHNFRTPIHHAFDIAIRPTNLPNDLKDKAFVAFCDKNGDITNVGSKWKNERLWGRSKTFGDYYIKVDTIAPRIQNVNFQENMRGRPQFTFKISDNFSGGGLDYRATVDGEWILMEHDAKTRRIFHRFDGRILKGEHQFQLVVTDALGNEEVFERTFVR